MIYKFAVMVTETIHRVKEVEIEAEDLHAAKKIMEISEHRFDKEYATDKWHFFVGDQDQGDVDEWPRENFTDEEQAALWRDEDQNPYFMESEMTNPVLTPVLRLDWIERLTPAQVAEEEAEHQRLMNDPEVKASVAAFRRAFRPKE